MSTDTWKLGPDDGTLTIHTGVGGRAARMGHRLTIAMNSWQIDVDWADGAPARVALGVDVDTTRCGRSVAYSSIPRASRR